MEGNAAQAAWAFLCGRFHRRFRFAPGHKIVHGSDNQKEDDQGDQQKRDHRVQKVADKKIGVVEFSGDSDFRRLVEAVQRRGVRVTVVSSIRTAPPMVADDLRRQADQFIELGDIAPEFTRRQTEPRTRSPLRLSGAENTPADTP